jgi:ACR3 family arsenite transporter
MIIGVLLGYYVPSIHSIIDTVQIADVSLPIAIGLLWMMYPVLCKVKYETLFKVFQEKRLIRYIAVALLLNVIIAPALMTALAWATLPDLPEHRSGVILVGAASCIAMVLVWNQLAQGDSEYCAILVAINSIIQILLYSPLAYFYIVIVGRESSLEVNMWLVTRSVLIFLGIPLVAGLLTRIILRKFFGSSWYESRFLPIIGPFSLLGLLFTVIIMFSSQGKRIVDNIAPVFRVSVPLILYFVIFFFAVFYACYRLRIPYPLAVTQSFTASSNNFELAISVAIATYGIDSNQALATVVGPLIEVPVLLSLVYVCKWAKIRWPVNEQNPPL